MGRIPTVFNNNRAIYQPFWLFRADVQRAIAFQIVSQTTTNITIQAKDSNQSMIYII